MSLQSALLEVGGPSSASGGLLTAPEFVGEFLLDDVVETVDFEELHDIEVEGEATFADLDVSIALVITVIVLGRFILVDTVRGWEYVVFLQALDHPPLALANAFDEAVAHFTGVVDAY